MLTDYTISEWVVEVLILIMIDCNYACIHIIMCVNYAYAQRKKTSGYIEYSGIDTHPNKLQK